ncbi:copper chaperone, partial [Linderina pennispora]
MSIKVEFAVDMTCQSCVDDIGQILSSTAGVTAYDISLADKTVLVSGTASPTQLLNAFKDSGRSAVVRGAGSTNGNIGAA